METLSEIYKRYSVAEDTGSGDKGTVHSYIPVYEKLLEPYRDGFLNFLEIGLARGLSIAMWREYFAPSVAVFGMDLSLAFDPEPLKQKDIVFIVGDSRTHKPHSFFNVIIDDGSHDISDQEATFRNLSPKMIAGGVYIIEDVNGVEALTPRFSALHPRMEVIDLRAVKGRFDDVLIVYRF